MKRFLINSTIFSLPILVIALILEISLRNIPNDYLLKKEYLDKNASKIEILILGSSHSFYGINPDMFTGNTFNASYISQSLHYDFEIIKNYQSRFKKLKTIILPISYFTLFTDLKEGSEAWRSKNYTIYFGFSHLNSHTEHSEILSNRLNHNIKRLVSYYISKNSQISCTKLGWGIKFHSKKVQSLEKTGVEAAKRHTVENMSSDKSRKTLNANRAIINNMILWCNKNNINLLFLTPPAYKTYRQHLNLEQLNYTIMFTKETCSKNNNCDYINLLEDSHFIEKDFFDADHLSENGAKKLSEMINSFLIK